MPRVSVKVVRNRYYDVLYKENNNRTVQEYVKLSHNHFSIWENGIYRTSSAQYEKEIRQRLEYLTNYK